MFVFVCSLLCSVVVFWFVYGGGVLFLVYDVFLLPCCAKCVFVGLFGRFCVVLCVFEFVFLVCYCLVNVCVCVLLVWGVAFVSACFLYWRKRYSPTRSS